MTLARQWAATRFQAAAIAALLLTLFNTCSLPAQEPAAIDWKLETTAPWQPRDSQAEYVLADRLWIAGGWFDSFATAAARRLVVPRWGEVGVGYAVGSVAAQRFTHEPDV